MKVLIIFLIALNGLFCGCSRDNTLEPKEKNFVPFKGTATWVGGGLQGAEGRCAQINPVFSTVIYAEGAGNMAHLGQITYEGTQCVDLTGTVMSPLAVSNIMTTMTAANGDEVYIEGEANIVPTDNENIFLVDGAFNITGGSGRFEGAEGGGTIGGEVEFAHFPPQDGDPPAPVTNIFDGMIAY